ncbi:GmrSD restriction endonuclease domain-containing protein [Erwinia amylovora]|uniref:GmrSD restriction endonuclease domain-containing protein n=1 Tax=Erwinia amylovora TaxID=552 RepID=UPI001443FEEB|nr:DUF262 domain-containing protein [Erwinia amylovora]
MGVGTLTIRKLLQNVAEGEIRIPAFQRDFVWEPDRVQFLMDSLFKKYPVGTLLLWRTSEKLEHDKMLGPYRLPEPKKHYPVEYVLDGQQRITSIFSVFQTELKKTNNDLHWLDIYYDLDASQNVQDSQFIALPSNEVKQNHIPLNILFDVKKYGSFVRNFPDQDRINEIDSLQAAFQEVQLPTETVEISDHSSIAIIFERVNRGGMPLDTYQLLSAWTWSGDFDLRAKFDELGDELDDHGYKDLADDADLLLKCCAAVIKDDASAKSIVALNGTDVRTQFEIFKRGLLGAVDFLRRDCSVASFKNMPYKSMLIPLAKCFATSRKAGFHPNAEQRAALVKWFWHSCFSRRYSNSVDTAVKADILAIKKLLVNDLIDIESRSVYVSPDFFLESTFSVIAVNTRIYVLMLANKRPKSFISGAPVDFSKVLISCNKREYHHIFPKDYLAKKLGVIEKKDIFPLANFAFLSKRDNASIQNTPPNEYVLRINSDKKEDILATHFISKDGLTLNYNDFLKDRAILLAQEANKLAN